MQNAVSMILPTALIALLSAVLAIVNYWPSQGSLLVARSLHDEDDAFAFASHHARTILAHDPGQNAVLVEVPDAAERQAFIQQGFLLMDAKGVPSCHQKMPPS
jgi:hypothetical protein